MVHKQNIHLIIRKLNLDITHEPPLDGIKSLKVFPRKLHQGIDVLGAAWLDVSLGDVADTSVIEPSHAVSFTPGIGRDLNLQYLVDRFVTFPGSVLHIHFLADPFLALALALD